MNLRKDDSEGDQWQVVSYLHSVLYYAAWPFFRAFSVVFL